jgi:hypothetical protein
MKSLTKILIIVLIVSCNPIKKLQKEINNAGYIYYTTPLQFAGTGTLVGGRPSQLNILSSNLSCFPNEIDGVPTNLRRYDTANLPTKQTTITTQGKINLDLLKILQNDTIRAGFNFSKIETISLEMKGIHIEYIDAIELSYFYLNSMSEICKDALDNVGFIIQALKVDELLFSFYDKSGNGMVLNLNNLNQFLDIGANLSFTIENKTVLHITSPKYIGYQLGRLLREDNGLSLYRSFSTSRDKFNFESLVLFSNEDILKKEYILKKMEEKPIFLN